METENKTFDERFAKSLKVRQRITDVFAAFIEDFYSSHNKEFNPKFLSQLGIEFDSEDDNNNDRHLFEVFENGDTEFGQKVIGGVNMLINEVDHNKSISGFQAIRRPDGSLKYNVRDFLTTILVDDFDSGLSFPDPYKMKAKEPGSEVDDKCILIAYQKDPGNELLGMDGSGNEEVEGYLLDFPEVKACIFVEFFSRSYEESGANADIHQLEMYPYETIEQRDDYLKESLLIMQEDPAKYIGRALKSADNLYNQAKRLPQYKNALPNRLDDQVINIMESTSNGLLSQRLLKSILSEGNSIESILVDNSLAWVSWSRGMDDDYMFKYENHHEDVHEFTVDGEKGLSCINSELRNKRIYNNNNPLPEELLTLPLFREIFVMGNAKGMVKNPELDIDNDPKL